MSKRKTWQLPTEVRERLAVEKIKQDAIERLEAATAKVERAEVEQTHAVAGALAAGVSWAEIARLAGLKSAQAAHYRWGPSTK